MMAKMIHSMIRVLEKERSIVFYKAALQLDVVDYFVFDEYSLIYLRNSDSDVELELTVNHDRTDAYQLGNGYGHLAVTVANLESEHQRLQAEGISPQPIKEMFRDGKLMARFFFIQDPDGYKIEVLQQHGRYI
jgi:lactoylglutathione lyase